MTGFIAHFDTARDYTLQFTITQTLVSTAHFQCCCLVAPSNGERSPFSEFPNCSQPQLPAYNSNSSQRLNPSSSVSSIIAVFSVTVEACLSAELLLSNVCCIVASFAVVA
jgi:hypothetical protein